MLRFFEGLVDPYCPYRDDETPPDRLWPFFLGYMRPFRRVVIWTAAISAVVAFFEIGLIYYAGRIVDLMREVGAENVLREHGMEFLAVGVLVLLLRPVLHTTDVAFINQALLPNLGTLVRWRSHRHVLKQSVAWFENDFAGRIANRIMQTAPATGEFAFQVFDAILYSIIYIIGATVLLGEISAWLALPLVVWLSLYIYLVYWTVPRVGRASREFSDARSEITGRIVDSYTNIHSVKLFAHTHGEEDYAREAIENSRVKFQRQMRLITIMELGLTTVNGFLIVSVIGMSIWLWTSGHSTLGSVAAAAALSLRLDAMTGWIMWSLSSLFENMGVIEEGMRTIAQPIALKDKPGARPIEVSRGGISVSGVTHMYGGRAGGVSGLSLEIKPGERIGLVGRSGAGKSTLVKLLLRFYDCEHGKIEIDGQNVSDVTQDSLRSAIGMVTQDSSLMHRSIRDNILYGRPGATEEEMVAAARRAEAHDFILGLEDLEGRPGYDAHVGERGVKLSGGERQRIALARVILKDAPILVLDEATSALDSESEAVIQQALYGVMEGKTVVAIAHRLSTIARMDRILVMEGGHIEEEGTHMSLLRRKGLYASFWERQSGGFIGIEEK